MLERITKFSMNHPWWIVVTAIVVTAFFALQFPKIKIDTDPENMLEPDQPDRVLYDHVKERFGINDLIVAGIEDEQGVFRKESLERIARITSEVLEIKGVIIEDVISLSTTDNVKSTGGFLDIRPVMSEAPSDQDAIQLMRRDIADNPFLDEKLASKDGTAVAMYIPIESKDISYRVAGEVEKILERNLLEGQKYHVAGLAVAEDTFGHEMFIQMAIVAPIAFVVILLLVFLLFRSLPLLIPVGVMAMFSVIWAMGLLIGTGHTVHIMSSMIPVFLMPIAILDSVHILSEFFDSFRRLADKRKALLEAMKPLYRPMLYTSVTSAVGFSSLTLAAIPPVRVFGLFVAFGILAAWILTITLVPAMISLMRDDRLLRSIPKKESGRSTIFDHVLQPLGRVAFSRAGIVVASGVVLIAIGVAGLTRINVNDNPVKWFEEHHALRVADTNMNRLFGGTYMAYLIAEGEGSEAIKRPEVVSYIDKVQEKLETDPIVGKTSSIADIVKRINLVLHDNDPAYNKVPDSEQAVGQFLFLFQSSGDPNDLDNFVDHDAQAANVWVQMKGGDNEQMARVERALASYVEDNPPPDGLVLRWSGLTYINKIWQDLMVVGMLKAVLGGFLVVFILMMIEFRSIRLGVLSMVPLSVAMVLTYGLVGWIGKDYDMPVAVCSALSLGLAIDFAIHFLQRYKMHFKKNGGNLEDTNRYMFQEPGRAIARNAIVISLGFLPLLLSNLTPYGTVGFFFALLMLFSTMATLVLLPAFMRLFGHSILKAR
ncbi:MAG: MMPL family transporter [Candidatus Latescibacteria bacterium]|nr:MMPL family transporter [Candidatus Latescibacterota bacterium]NIM21287.1 MMPL family transporter [Candidatus Latescibacterota bacterium]NIM64545.1 MMPL family transporter [Candidatus Latescibacterota bacterium]NIO00702.1 MMPL family transporter [Candidatus Latescibacterota bacterium]NIO27101.1 MMPL family transporter [Candidatus Latescibacterota bacterium]